MIQWIECLRLKHTRAALAAMVLSLIFSQSAGATLVACQQAHKKSVESCKEKGAEARRTSDETAAAVRARCKIRFNANTCPADMAQAGTEGTALLGKAVEKCESGKKACEDACQTSSADKDREAKVKIKNKCGKEIEELQSELRKGQGGADSAAKGGEATSDAASGKGENQAQSSPPPPMPPPPPPPSEQNKPPETQPQSIPPNATAANESLCEGPNAHLHVQCKQKVEADCKVGATGAAAEKCSGFCSGIGGDTPYCQTSNSFKTASANYCSRAGKEMCPGCSGFQKQCPGDAASCLRQMSATQVQNIRSNCADGPGAADLGVANALNASEREVGFASSSAPITGGSGGGGGSSGYGGGAGGGAVLDDADLIRRMKAQAEADTGPREMGSLNVDSSGGYSGGGDDGGFGSLKSDDPFSLPASGSGGRSVASDFSEQSVPGVSDVQNRHGPSLFSISSGVLKARCQRGMLLHCRPRTK